MCLSSAKGTKIRDEGHDILVAIARSLSDKPKRIEVVATITRKDKNESAERPETSK